MIERRTTYGQSMVTGDVHVTPTAQVVTVRLPFGAFVWHAPTGVLVERAGRVERLPIVDVTRIAQIALGVCALAAFVALRRVAR